ncbi:MAG: hypothetical protein ACJ8OJ_02900 [Povalibacter sp.]
MGYTLTIDQTPDYLYAVVSGRSSKKTLAACLAEVMAECERRQCFRVLIEKNLQGRHHRLIDAFDLSTRSGRRITQSLHDMACVPEQQSDVHTAGDIAATHRSLHLALFDDAADATAWLMRDAETAPSIRAAVREIRPG